MAARTSWRGAARVAPQPTTTPSPDDALAATLASLPDLDLDALRQLWRRRLGGKVPAHLPRALLLRLIAYKLQAQAFGDLAPETARMLDRLAREETRARESAAAGQGRAAQQDATAPSSAAPPAPVPSASVPPVPEPRGPALKPGTLLVREHRGVVQRVMVLDSGFAWNGTAYASLSEIAREITGTRWSGPKFFGLREGRPARSQAESAPARAGEGARA